MPFHTEEAIYVDTKGNVVAEDSPEVHQMFAAPHSDISDTVAEDMGLVGGKKKDPLRPGDVLSAGTAKSVQSQKEAADVQPNHANPVLIDEDGDGNFEDVHKAEDAQLGPGGMPEFRGHDDARARLRRTPDRYKDAAEKVAKAAAKK